MRDKGVWAATGATPASARTAISRARPSIRIGSGRRSRLLLTPSLDLHHELTAGSAAGGAARSGLSSERSDVRAVAAAFGYSPAELASIPAQANLGLSCGNPTAFASLRPGEVVVDLGCGGGLDVFLAARKVGPAGRAIGTDMTDAMIELWHSGLFGRMPTDAAGSCAFATVRPRQRPERDQPVAKLAGWRLRRSA